MKRKVMTRAATFLRTLKRDFSLKKNAQRVTVDLIFDANDGR